ncbi:stage IV sporulation protein A [uncultured Ruthenibacterium sp.]|uniref:stage IV sporulation protein A n=1 Tax=uncultured Ruthenibacterium sp. TaxID=1905347 RepID=UPI00349EEAD1
MLHSDIYADIANRTGGDIYIGIVGPVRTGKSTFIKRFMELMVLPEIQNDAFAQRARDELPQSAAGRTIMTTEPKFVPEQAVSIELDNGVTFRTRLIDCVGYMVTGAMGHEEDEKPRMVKSPWFDEEIPFDVAAETGTRKVICDHSTIGLVITTDGTISDIPRAEYEQAEQRVIAELDAIQKPYVILLNSVTPDAPSSVALANELSEKYGKPVLPISCVDLTAEDITEILKHVLFEFPMKEIAFAMPKWVTALEPGHWLQDSIYKAIQQYAENISIMKEAIQSGNTIQCEYIKGGHLRSLDMGTGCIVMELSLQDDIFYKILSEETGLEVFDEASLMPCIISLANIRRKYEKIESALEEVNATGYGIVMPSMDELRLEEPEIMRQGGRYGVRLRASAPSIHMMRADIATEVAPIVGTEKQSEELVNSLLSDFEAEPLKIWQSNIFGKSLHELVNEGLQNKLLNMPPEARQRIQQTLERVINEGCSGLICIIL